MNYLNTSLGTIGYAPRLLLKRLACIISLSPLRACLDTNIKQEKGLIASPSRAPLRAYSKVFVTTAKSCSTRFLGPPRGTIQTSLLHREEGLQPWPLLSPMHSN